MTMRYNKLGDSGLLVSELSFGSWVTFQVRHRAWRAHAHRRRSCPRLVSSDTGRCCVLLQNDGQVSEGEACLALMKEAYLGGVRYDSLCV
jgi:aryl-alcohol dehydrogenase-like predicted oxidoreductase